MKNDTWKAVMAGALFGLLLAGFALPRGTCIGWPGVIGMCGPGTTDAEIDAWRRK